VALTWTTVSFWTKIWTEVSFSSLAKTQIPYAIQNEPHGVKNKRVKPQVPIPYLALNLIVYLKMTCIRDVFISFLFEIRGNKNIACSIANREMIRLQYLFNSCTIPTIFFIGNYLFPHELLVIVNMPSRIDTSTKREHVTTIFAHLSHSVRESR